MYNHIIQLMVIKRDKNEKKILLPNKILHKEFKNTNETLMTKLKIINEQ